MQRSPGRPLAQLKERSQSKRSTQSAPKISELVNQDLEVESCPKIKIKRGQIAYRHHRQENEPGRSGFLCTIGGVDQAVDGGGCKNQSACKVAHHRNMVGLCGVRSDHDEDAANHKEIVDDGPPCVRWKTIPCLNLSNDRGDEGNHPCQL